MRAVMKRVMLMALLGLISIGCKKNEESEVLPINEETNLQVRNDSIEVGNSSEMIVQTYNKNLNGNASQSESYSIDVNQDGINDFKLLSRVWGEELGMEVPVTEIVCLHSNAMIQSHEVLESVYLKNEIEIKNRGTKVEKVINRYYSCEEERGAVLFRTREELKPDFKEEYDFIRNADVWEGRSIVLTQGPYEHPLNQLYQTADSIVYQKIHYDMVCNELPGNNTANLGIKVKSGGVEKLGWLKMRITGFNKVFLIESAFEK
jgi:hypothetical protein